MDEELKKYLDGKFAAQDEQTGQMRENLAKLAEQGNETFAKLAEQVSEKFAKQTEQMGEMAGGLRAETSAGSHAGAGDGSARRGRHECVRTCWHRGRRKVWHGPGWASRRQY